LELKRVTETTAELDVEFAGEVLHVAYRPYVVTVREAISPEQTAEEMVYQAARAIARWDLTDGGVPVPVSEEALSALPIALVAAVVVAIAEDLQHGPNPSGSI
jgi:hypothetical protein